MVKASVTKQLSIILKVSTQTLIIKIGIDNYSNLADPSTILGLLNLVNSQSNVKF